LCPKTLTEFDQEWRVLKNTKLPFLLEKDIKVDEFWRYISNIKKGDGSVMFPLLSSFVEKLLCLPHSSANVERLFSSVNLMKTDLQNKLSTKSLTGLLYTKSTMNVPCYEVQASEEHYALFNKIMYNFKNTTKVNKTSNKTETDSELDSE